MIKTEQHTETSAYTGRQVFMALASIFLSYMMYSYYIQTPGNAAPRIAADLDGMSLYSWAVSIPALGLAFSTLLAGKLSDIYGRRLIMQISMGIFVAGTVLCAVSPTYIFLIAARTILCLGQGALAPLVFAVVGDMFAPSERSKWVGLLNIPLGIFAVFGPSLGGWLVDSLSWRHIFWWGIPVLVLCFIFMLGMPPLIQGATRKIDLRGSALVAVASSTLIFGLSFAGTTYPWGSVQVIGLLVLSVAFWAWFLSVESKAPEPILDINVLRNRTFLTVAGAGFFSFFGMMAMNVYYPLLLQGIQGLTALRSGQILTPLGVLMSFVGVPVGFVLAHSKRYKWMYVTGYGLMMIVMIGMILYDASTPVALGFLATTIAGLGLGAIPTINTLVIQYAVPKRLLGVAMGASFFTISMGVAISPAILGSVMNMSYNSRLKSLLPPSLVQTADEATLKALGDPKVLLSKPDMDALRETLGKREDGQALLDQTVQAIRNSMESGIKAVFILSAITMFLAFLLITTIREIPMEEKVEIPKTEPESVVV